MSILFQIVSAEKGKQCDFYPFGSLHENQYKIHDFCKTEVYVGVTKKCPGCDKQYPNNWPFVNPNQWFDRKEICSNCFERKYIVNAKDYRECIRQETLRELKLNGNTG